MRVIDTIPHKRFKIQVFTYNGKFTIKVELDQYEQSYKIGETDVMGVADVKAMVTTEFLNTCLKRFVEMRQDWYNAFKNKNNSPTDTLEGEATNPIKEINTDSTKTNP